MTKSEIIKQLAADLKESAARNRMQREGGHYVEVDAELSTAQYKAYGMAEIEYSEGVQVAVECHAGILTLKTGNVEIISNLIKNLLQ
jgi:hypothetical protein